MKIKDYKETIIPLLIFVVIVLIALLIKKPKFIFDDSGYIKIENELRHEIDSLNNVVKIEVEAKNKFEAKIDSLSKVKKRVKYVYVQKTKKIDTASVNYLIKEFKAVFTANGVK